MASAGLDADLVADVVDDVDTESLHQGADRDDCDDHDRGPHQDLGRLQSRFRIDIAVALTELSELVDHGEGVSWCHFDGSFLDMSLRLWGKGLSTEDQ